MAILQEFFFGLLLGWGAAIPIGPINLEMTRRNLRYGTWAGMAIGWGAGLADLTYLVLLSVGALQLLEHRLFLKILGIAGALILAWFAYKALSAKSQEPSFATTPAPKMPLYRHFIEGYLLTLINPPTLLFWSSISSLLAVHSHALPYALLYAGAGVISGTFSWSTGLNIFLHISRHRLTTRTMHRLNLAGGLLLLGFALLGFWRSLHL